MNKPFVVGIAGGSASGKSTFADLLVEALDGLKIEVFHMDHYFKPEERRPHVKAPVTGIVYTDDNHPDTMDIPQMRRDLAASIESGSAHASGRAAADVIVAEGLLTLYDDEICGMLDLRLFMECRPDERIVRRLRRNMSCGLGFDEIANVYLDMVRYRHDEYVEPSKWRADLILNGSSFSNKALAVVADAVRTGATRNRAE